MARLRTNRVNQTVVLVAVCAGSAMMGFVLGGNKAITPRTSQQLLSQQSDEKVIERMEFPNEPFEFGNLRVKKIKIAPGQKFSARSLAQRAGGHVEDWLENLEFTLTNKSEKRMVYIDIALQFPHPDGSGGVTNYGGLGIGINPRASGDRAKHATPLSLNPGDTVTFTLSAEELERIKKFFLVHYARRKNFRLGNLNKAVITIGRVIFDDGTMWHLGNYRPIVDPSDEKVIERRVFPNEPFELGNLAVKNVKLAPPESYHWWATSGVRYKFSARRQAEIGGGEVEDWLENLQFTLKNKSDKRITHFLLELQFPETGVSSGSLMVHHVKIGIQPKASADELKHRKPLALDPGDTITFTLSAQELKLMKDFLALGKFQLAELNKAAIKIGNVFFDDGTMWEQGYWYRPNPSAPGGYERIKQ